MKSFYISFLALLLNSCYSSYAPVTFDEPKRLLLLDGEDGTVACRIYGPLMSGTLPRFSDNWTIESATRSLLRMKNLTAVRGHLGAGMMGPYF